MTVECSVLNGTARASMFIGESLKCLLQYQKQDKGASRELYSVLLKALARTMR